MIKFITIRELNFFLFESIKKGEIILSVETLKQTEKEFLDYVKKITAYHEAISLIYWDLRTKTPKKGVEGRSEIVGILSAEAFKMSTSQQMKEYLAILLTDEAKNHLSEITIKTALDCQKQLERMEKIPEKEFQQFVQLRAQSESVWAEAKEKRDFQLFQPYLQKLVNMTKQFIQYWGYQGHPYNTLLDQYEPEMTVDKLDNVFKDLREQLIALLKKIENSSVKWDSSFLYTYFPKEKQEAFSLEILRQLGYDFDAGRLDETVHPFAIGLNYGDVRITTKYDEYDFRVGIFGTIHEAGHAVYEQNIAKELFGTTLAQGTSMGIHESQSLFYENFIGRNYYFWKKNYDLLKKYANGQFDNISLDHFYRAINEVKPSLIRIEADELTYPLHIIIRYEIEKALFNDEIEVKDLPEIWNKKYEEYLGVVPEHDGHGVLQDIHWSGGDFGYFPSYALGYLYAAQLKYALLKEINNFDELLAEGNIEPIKNWFTRHVHQYGKMKKPLEIIKEATGEELNGKYLIHYLTEKYSHIYQF